MPFTNHTLVVNSPLRVEQGRIGMSFNQGSGVSFDIDPSQNINITFTSHTAFMEMELKNNSGIYVENVDIIAKIPKIVPNPETGADSFTNPYLTVIISILALFTIIVIIRRRIKVKHD